MDGDSESNQTLTFELIKEDYTPLPSPEYSITFNFCFEFINPKGEKYLSIQDSAHVSFIQPSIHYEAIEEVIDEVFTRLPLSASDNERDHFFTIARAEAFRVNRRTKLFNDYQAVDLDILVHVQDNCVFDSPEEQSTSECSCCICLEEFSGGGEAEAVGLPCSHVFHEDCIEKWLRATPNCPLCRMPIDDLDAWIS